ncbi:hypothetical protein [Phenylobacterium sp. RIFCSPHIGHO2_01_FULL_69_31]|nr:hypothetical protein [Phenylobacterium sp. RIFCSPHIGHO2_01_FULL_69_31]
MSNSKAEPQQIDKFPDLALHLGGRSPPEETVGRIAPKAMALKADNE